MNWAENTGDSMQAGAVGYANSLNDIPMNIGKNAIVSRYTNGIQKINILPKALRNFGQNVSSEYLLNKEKQENNIALQNY